MDYNDFVFLYMYCVWFTSLSLLSLSNFDVTEGQITETLKPVNKHSIVFYPGACLLLKKYPLVYHDVMWWCGKFHEYLKDTHESM